MNKTDLMNMIAGTIKQYERDNREVVGCFLRFETENKEVTPAGNFEWHTYQYDGNVFHDRQEIEFTVVKRTSNG